MFLAAAYEIGADYLVSLDKKHILPLKHDHYTQILSPDLFLQVLQNS
jgi:predicted nucleic acid-binding protein